MAVLILNQRFLEKSFVALTFLLMAATLLYIAQENETLNANVMFVLDSKNPFASTGNLISTKSKDESQATFAASQNQGQSSHSPQVNGKPMVRNSGTDVPHPNGPTDSATKNNAQIQDSMNAKSSANAIVKHANLSQINLQGSNPHATMQSSNKQGVLQVQNKSETQLPFCKAQNKTLVGRLQVNQSVPDMEDIASSWNEENWVVNGGAWRPITCLSVSKVAIIIPYRDRYPQLKIFLRHMHPILKRQLLDYRIIVVEQNGNTIFNRAMLFNIGYKEALKFHDFQCFVFHDVDLLPEDDRNYYGCPSRPRHLSVAVDTMKYRLPYATIFGGVGVLTKEQFEKINGFSNQFWGWGGEDDDLYKRIRAVNYTLSRPMIELGRYTMVRVGHKSAPKDPKRHEKLRNSKSRMTTDGLNSLKYEIVKTNEYQLYTQITVNVDPNAV